MMRVDNGKKHVEIINGVRQTIVDRPATCGMSYMPLTPAWAVTVHKAQGLTIAHPTRVEMEDWFGNPGSVYVACSRVKNPEDLTLVHADNQLTKDGEILTFSRDEYEPGLLGQRFPFRNAGRLLYGFVATNRYSLSKCRGGACRVAKPEAVRRQARLGAFWSCYTLGFFIRLPLVVWAGIKAAAQRTSIFVRTYHKRLDLLNGKLTILFLNGVLPNAVPLLFGELFTAVLYDGIAIDPGSPKMRRSLARHLRRVKPKIAKIIATHAHEEHVGNLNWLSEVTGAPIYVSEMTARFLTPFKKLPWVRATIIGQPPNLKHPTHLLGETVDTESGRLQVIATPGHCDDHVVLYDPKEKVLLAGDAFMGSYFATPNPDVDSRKWLVSLERLMELDIEILVEGHGHIHTLRADIPDFPGVVIRQDPKVAISQKLDYLRWLREQIEVGFQEQLPVRVIEASCFAWGKRSSWESCATDECIRLLSLGHFSRSELVRSFVRTNDDQLPTVYEVRMSGGD